MSDRFRSQQATRKFNSAQRPVDVEDDLVVVGTRVRLAGMDKLDALDIIIDCFDAEWSDKKEDDEAKAELARLRRLYIDAFGTRDRGRERPFPR